MLRHFRFISRLIFVGVAKQSQLGKMAATHFRWFAEPLPARLVMPGSTPDLP